MIKSTLLFLIMFLPGPGPLGVSWEDSYNYHPDILGYSYYYGDYSWGHVVYSGRADILGMETEAQLFFSRKKITKAYLIFGPAGLSNWNCMKKYKEVRSLLIFKYGVYNFIREEKDPLIKDLLFVSPCGPISLGLHKISTYWTRTKYQIVLEITASDEDLYIEITYINRNKEKIRKKEERLKIIKKF